MYHVLFKYGEITQLGRCVITSETDTGIENYYTSTEDDYIDFTNLSPRIGLGEKVFHKTSGYIHDFIGVIKAVSSTTITLPTSPGQRAYNEVLKNGYIEPYVKRAPVIYSYPIENYIGARLNKAGEYYNTYAQTNPNGSDATTVNTHSTISLYFKKINKYDDVKISVRLGSESNVIKAINKAFREKKDIDFSSSAQSIHTDIFNIKSITSPFIKGFY